MTLDIATLCSVLESMPARLEVDAVQGDGAVHDWRPLGGGQALLVQEDRGRVLLKGMEGSFWELAHARFKDALSLMWLWAGNKDVKVLKETKA